MSEFHKQIFCDTDSRFSVIIDDDGKVAYAYLLENDSIIGDIWLYNQHLTPIETDWSSKREMPYLNPKEYIEKEISPIENDDEVNVKWIVAEGEIREVIISIRDFQIAKMQPGSKPGWSAIVRKDGPLAKCL